MKLTNVQTSCFFFSWFFLFFFAKIFPATIYDIPIDLPQESLPFDLVDAAFLVESPLIKNYYFFGNDDDVIVRFIRSLWTSSPAFSLSKNKNFMTYYLSPALMGKVMRFLLDAANNLKDDLPAEDGKFNDLKTEKKNLEEKKKNNKGTLDQKDEELLKNITDQIIALSKKNKPKKGKEEKIKEIREQLIHLLENDETIKSKVNEIIDNNRSKELPSVSGIQNILLEPSDATKGSSPFCVNNKVFRMGSELQRFVDLLMNMFIKDVALIDNAYFPGFMYHVYAACAYALAENKHDILTFLHNITNKVDSSVGKYAYHDENTLIKKHEAFKRSLEDYRKKSFTKKNFALPQDDINTFKFLMLFYCFYKDKSNLTTSFKNIFSGKVGNFSDCTDTSLRNLSNFALKGEKTLFDIEKIKMLNKKFIDYYTNVQPIAEAVPTLNAHKKWIECINSIPFMGYKRIYSAVKNTDFSIGESNAAFMLVDSLEDVKKANHKIEIEDCKVSSHSNKGTEHMSFPCVKSKEFRYVLVDRSEWEGYELKSSLKSIVIGMNYVLNLGLFKDIDLSNLSWLDDETFEEKALTKLVNRLNWQGIDYPDPHDDKYVFRVTDDQKLELEVSRNHTSVAPLKQLSVSWPASDRRYFTDIFVEFPESMYASHVATNFYLDQADHGNAVYSFSFNQMKGFEKYPKSTFNWFIYYDLTALGLGTERLRHLIFEDLIKVIGQSSLAKAEEERVIKLICTLMTYYPTHEDNLKKKFLEFLEKKVYAQTNLKNEQKALLLYVFLMSLPHEEIAMFKNEKSFPQATSTIVKYYQFILEHVTVCVPIINNIFRDKKDISSLLEIVRLIYDAKILKKQECDKLIISMSQYAQVRLKEEDKKTFLSAIESIHEKYFPSQQTHLVSVFDVLKKQLITLKEKLERLAEKLAILQGGL